MKKLFATALVTLFFAAVASAQSAPAPVAQPGAPTDQNAPAQQAAPAAAPAPAPQTPAATPGTGAQAAQPATAAQQAAPATGTPGAAAETPSPAPSNPAREPSFLEQELEAASSEMSSGQVGAMTFEDLEKVAEHVAIAMQKERYVQRARNASFMLPGLGQFMVGDTLGGWLFVAWDVTVLAGTLVSAYFVLPANVQFASLDYFGSSLSTIRTAWASNTITSYLPFAGVLAGGIILETVLRYVAADNAAKTARKNIDQGKVTFQPTLDVLGGGLGVGLKMTY